MDGNAESRVVAPCIAIIGLDRRLAEPLIALAETEGWAGMHLPRRFDLGNLSPSAVVLDADSLGVSLWKCIVEVRARFANIGVIVLASHSVMRNRIRALQLGADFFWSKSLDPVELMALIVVSSRAGRNDPIGREAVTVGGLRLEGGRVWADGIELDLTPRQRVMLQFLVSNQGRLVARGAIYEAVWDGATTGGERSVDAVIARLRRRLERASPDHCYIHTHYKVGYRFEAVSGPAVPPRGGGSGADPMERRSKSSPSGAEQAARTPSTVEV